MASYTDAITQFNPYVQQLPVELMMQVGMHKQAQYDAGVQKIQSYIDNVAGLDIYKDGHKKYLESKLGELGNNLRTVAAGDFSNQQLVNSVGGMASSVMKDPIIQNAVYSTQKIRKGTKEMEEAKKKGDLTPQNKYLFDESLNSFLSDPDLEKRFDGSYENYFDINKFGNDLFSKVTKGKIKWEDVYEHNSDGSLKIEYIKDKKGNIVSSQPVLSKTMKTHIQEGILPEVVQSTINQIISDPRVSRQLAIDGHYKYRGLDSDLLKAMALSQKEILLEKADDQLASLMLDKSTGRDVDAQIEATKLQIQDITTKYDNLVKLSIENPESVKSKLYTQSFSDNMKSMYGTMTHEIDTKENPEWNQNFKLTQEANEIARETRRLAQAWAIHKDDVRVRKEIAEGGWKNAALLAKIRASKGAGEAVDTDGDGIDDVWIPGGGVGGGAGLTPEYGENPADEGTYYNRYLSDYETASGAFNNAQNNLIWNTTLSKIGDNANKLQKLINAGIPQEQAINQLIVSAGSKAKDGVAGFTTRWAAEAMKKINSMTPAQLAKQPDLLDLKNTYNNAKTNFNDVSKFKNQIDSNVSNMVGKSAYESTLLTKLKPIKGTYKGEEFTLSPQDQLDLALYVKGYENVLFDTSGLIDKGVRGAADAAAQRLSAKGLGFLLDQTLRRSGKNQQAKGDLPSSLVRKAQGLKSAIGSGFSKLITGQWGTADVDLDPVMKIAKDLDSDVYSKVFKQTIKQLKQHYNTDPDLKLGLLTGDTETDKGIMADLRRRAAGATEAEKNLSPDLDKFAEALEDENFGLKKGSLEARIINGSTNNPMVEIVAGTPSSGRLGGMVVSLDAARNMGLNIEGIYEPTNIRILKGVISQNGGKTSAGDPSDKKTYRNNDVQFVLPNFKNLKQFNGTLDVRGNMTYQNGKYYGHVYVKDNKGREVLRTTMGDENLERAYKALTELDINDIKTLFNE